MDAAEADREREGALVWRFDAFEIDRANRELRREGHPIPLGSRYFDALVLLAAHPGELVTKNRFMDEVWRGIPVTDEALTQCIRTLRRALGDEAGDPRFVATVPKHGYRFLAEVERSRRDGSGPSRAASAVGGSAGGRIAGAATIGGGIAGTLGGLFYGLLGTSGGGTGVLVMAALVAALGVLGGAGVGIGMGVAAMLRGAKPLALISGAALGGALVGAFGQPLGRDGIAALTGARVVEITGLFEGLVLGLAVGMIGALALTAGWRERSVMGLSAIAGGAAGAIIALSGGSLLGRSLMLLEAQFPGSDLALDRVGRAFGEDGFYMFTQLATSVLEGAAFTACVAAALLHANLRQK
ncbi:transcriptional regulator [Qipengyuania sp. MTN3-11]|uniref:winged helix-turn-helix domain-containing protein n=1 Tax=Qipengyuania sp. MTN3-11 TaxID=3056557 RepID=UPI0036F32A33